MQLFLKGYLIAVWTFTKTVLLTLAVAIITASLVLLVSCSDVDTGNYCGNNKIDATEMCDGTAFNKRSWCPGQTLVCDEDCKGLTITCCTDDVCNTTWIGEEEYETNN
jgi:hypothetical protein